MRYTPVTRSRYLPTPGDVFTTTHPWSPGEYLATHECARAPYTFLALSLTTFELLSFPAPTPTEAENPEFTTYTKVGRIEP